VLWGVAIGLDWLIVPFVWRRLPQAYIVVSHLTERYGTFFIIVLGESVVAVVAGVAGFEFTLQAWVIAITCFIAGLCLWWIYFDLADTSVLGRGVLGLIYIYAHFPLLAGVAAFGAGTKLAITHAGGAGLEAGARWALGGGIAAFALSLSALHLGAEWTTPHDRTFISRLVLAAVAIVLAAAGDALSPVAFVLLIAAAVLGQLLVEAFTFPVGAATVFAPQPLAESELAGEEVA
jgi:low temperature requirement protein LtrA